MMRVAFMSCVLFASLAQAYPIPPRTLWDLAREAEVIVVARVGDFHNAPRQPNSFAEAERDDSGRADFVRLHVTETLKGKPVTTVDVVTNAGYVCPAPPRFISGRAFIAFLSAHDGQWHVTALSYGVLYPREEDLPWFKSLLSRGTTLQQNPVSEKQRIEWALEAASRRATRWDGVYELQSASDSLHRFYDRKERPLAKLTKEQQLALAKAFVAEPSADHSVAGLIELLAGVDVPGLEAALVGAIDVLVKEDGYTAIDAMRALVKRKKGDVNALIGGSDSALSVVDLDAGATWKKIRETYALPPGAQVPRQERLGVGEDSSF